MNMTRITPSITRPEPMPGWKRAIDVACCLMALPVFALFTLVMTIVMQIVAPGPVFFRQPRVGYRQRRFMCYKFRTMIVGADSKIHQRHCEDLIRSNAPMVKIDSRSDSRVIPGGWLLRASGLDELPQIINVLRGDMSLVGPRPCVPYESKKFLPWQRERFSAIPGLTGLWQVSGKNRTTFEEMLRLDVSYARNVSCWQDLKIMLMTVPALVRQISDTRRARRLSIPETPAHSAGVLVANPADVLRRSYGRYSSPAAWMPFPLDDGRRAGFRSNFGSAGHRQ
jgi:lipopolysaccharide/colanic/teichoic acid biosynthesis glycosyltransferase